ncbi:MAG: DUF1501 domain-containing protein [Saprospiraceae bacterium]
MKRRDFLKAGSASAISVPVLLNGLSLNILPKAGLLNYFNLDTDKVLVLIQLQGGNDGLNTVIPLTEYDKLANVRSNIIIPDNQVLKLNDDVGLHPSMTGLKSLWDNARLSLIHSAGYPNQNRSHFRSTDIWTSASDANEFESRGWLGRYFDTQYDNYPDGYPNSENPDPIAITMGYILSETCQGIAANYSLSVTDPFGISPLLQGQGSNTPDEPYGWELEFLRQAIASTNAYGDVIKDAANLGSNMVTYPDGNNLAAQLKNVALLISGGLQTKVYVCSIGGFDTHSAQVVSGDTSTGIHANLLEQLSSAITAFQQDLQAHGLEERVVGMTFSEFGRQIASNFSDGTDHGTAAPMFVFGSCISESIHGSNPEIPEMPENQEGVAMQNDFRNIYGSILQDWFQVPEEEIRSLIFADYVHMDIVKDCNKPLSTTNAENLNFEVQAYPNPFVSEVVLKFTTKKERVQLALYGTLGEKIETIFDRTLSEGSHEIRHNGSKLPPGNYYYRLQVGDQQVTKLVIKQ